MPFKPPSLPGFYGVLAGVIIILIALDIVLLGKGIWGIETTIAVNLIVIGILLIIYSLRITDTSDKLYYSFWGFFLILVSVSLTLYWMYNDIVMGIAVFLAGLGGLIIYASIMQR